MSKTIAHGARRYCDVAILTAQDQELASFLRLATEVEEREFRDEKFFSIKIKGPQYLSTASEATGVVMPIGGVGRVNSAIATSRLLDRFSPGAIFLVGIAGGFSKSGVSLGDIIVARRIIDYETRRLTDDGEEFRLKYFDADSDLLAAAHGVQKTDWIHLAQYPPRIDPKVHIGSVLSGDKILASEDRASSFLRLGPDLVGIEMEGAGVAAAASRGTGSRFLMIRGVVDLANAHKRDDAKIWNDCACDAAAAFTLATAIRTVQ